MNEESEYKKPEIPNSILSYESYNTPFGKAYPKRPDSGEDDSNKHSKIKGCLSGVTTFFKWILVLTLIGSGVAGGYYVFSHYTKDENKQHILEELEQLKQSAIESTGREASPGYREYNEVLPETLTPFTNDELAKLGIIELPEGFYVQEEYKGIKFVASRADRFSETQLSLMKMFVDLTPKRLLMPGPAAVVTFSSSEIDIGETTSEQTAAFASGPYIFFNDTSFEQGNLGMVDDSIDQVYNTFEHELTHVMQFNSLVDKLDRKSIDGYYKEHKAWTDILIESDLIESFASVTGWEKDPISSFTRYELPNKEDELTTEYGKTKIYEDMAEVVAGVIQTKYYKFSKGRVQWTLDILGSSSTDDLKEYKFPFSPIYEQVKIKGNATQFDSTKISEFNNKYDIVDIQYFVADKVGIEDKIAIYIENEMKDRGWEIGMHESPYSSDGFQRDLFLFTSKYRDIYLEISSYDNATGYSVKPSGTMITVLSGYKLPK